MKLSFFIIILLTFFSCKQKFDTKTYQENKKTLAQRESGHPEQFLKISSNDKKNLFGATVVKGKIVNTASVAAYKNARVKMLCYKNGIRVEEHEDVIPNIIKPGTVQNFKTKYHLPKGTDSLSFFIVRADTVNNLSANN